MTRPLASAFALLPLFLASHVVAASQPPGPPASLGRGMQRAALGLLPQALADLRLATSESPEWADAWIERGKLESRLGLFPDAEASLDRALSLDAENASAAAAAARFRLRLLDLDGAERLLAAPLAAARPAAAVLVAAGSLAVARRRDAEAIDLFCRALEIDKSSADAWAGLAAAKELLEEHDAVILVCESALSLDPRHADALVTLGYALFRKGDPLGATERFLEALRADPWHAGAHTYLGNGIVAEPEGFPPRDAAGARSLVRAGAAACRRGEFAAAIEKFRAAIALDPLDGLAHNGFAVALERLADRFAEDEGLFVRARVTAGLSSEPPEMEKFVLRAESLAPEDRAAVLRSIRPFERYLPRLATLGATHDIVPLDQGITEPEYGASFRGRRTFDLRAYDGLRGQGGFNAGTGVEKIAAAASLRFNMFAHEFAHQVHLFAFDASEREEIARLFDAAKRETRFLDFYAASNVEEYFAVGAEAYVSPRKRPGLSVTAGHTRGELLDKDPALFMFIRRLEFGAKPDEPSPFDRGDSLLGRNRFEEAARAYGETPRTSSLRRLALVRSAEAWALAGKSDLAESALDEAGYKAPQNDLQAVRAELWLRRETEPGEALQSLRDLSGYGRRRADLCDALVRMGDPYEAANRARDLITSEPASTRAPIALGRAASLRGDLAAAERFFRDALRASRALASVHGELGVVLSDMGRFEEAEEERRLALLAEPTNAEVLALAGEIRRLAGNPTGALAHFDEALRLDPEDGSARLGRARSLLDLGDERDAIAERDRAIERLLAPPPRGATGLDAIRAIAPFGDRIAGLAFRAAMRFDRGENALADADLRAAMALGPYAREILGVALRREGLPDVAARFK